MIMCHYFLDLSHFRGWGRNSYKKGFIFGRFEDTKISFRDYLTFKEIDDVIRPMMQVIYTTYVFDQHYL